MADQLHLLAGKTVPPSMLVNIPKLITAYFAGKPDPAVPSQRVAFGTSGHRGSAFDTAFNEAHILAISQAICDHRRQRGITGPLFIGIDTHALSEPALGQRFGGVRCQRRRRDDRRAGRLHADPGHLPRNPDLQPEPHERTGRWRRHHPLA